MEISVQQSDQDIVDFPANSIELISVSSTNDPVL